jgi:hypothetical protein
LKVAAHKITVVRARDGAKIEVWNRKNEDGWAPLRIAEGHRSGDFKPSAETITALHSVMLAASVTPNNSSPPLSPKTNYSADEAKKPGP